MTLSRKCQRTERTARRERRPLDRDTSSLSMHTTPHHTTSHCTAVQLYTAQRTMYTVVCFFADMTRTNNCTINDLTRPLTCIDTTRQRCCSNVLKRTTVTWVMSNLAGATRTIYNASLDSRSAEKHLLRSTVTSQSVDVGIVYWYRKLTTNIISQMSRRHTQYKRHKKYFGPSVYNWVGFCLTRVKLPVRVQYLMLDLQFNIIESWCSYGYRIIMTIVGLICLND